VSRGVLFIVWKGDCNTPDLLDRAIAGVRETNPTLPVHVQRLPDGSTLLDKARMLEYSPFDETLFLDADTVALGDLSYGFEQAKRHDVACCINECPWARRYLGLAERGDLVEYNTGVLFFTKAARPLFDEWQRQNETLNSAHYFLSARGRECMPLNDQAGFAAAVDALGWSPFVLPMNWNFRKRWHFSLMGPVKVWHDYDDPTPDILGFNEEHAEPGSVIRQGVLSSALRELGVPA